MALYAIGAIAILASANALAHSYAGLYDWAVHHRLGGWQAKSWPAEIDIGTDGPDPGRGDEEPVAGALVDHLGIAGDDGDPGLASRGRHRTGNLPQ